MEVSTDRLILCCKPIQLTNYHCIGSPVNGGQVMRKALKYPKFLGYLRAQCVLEAK